MRRRRLLIALGFAVAAVAAAALLIGGSPEAERGELLPDLDQVAPGELSGRTVGGPDDPRFYLGFESAAENVGDGPLIVRGSRAGVAARELKIVQQIRSGDGSTRSVPISGTLLYVRSSTHEHWHLLDFMTYELRREDGSLVAPDQKTGFCLGDRYEILRPVDGSEAGPTFTDECGKGNRQLLQLTEGISVGYGDNYEPHLEGQNFDISRLPAGRYLLVHRVNTTRAIVESDYENNASSLAFRLAWPNGKRLPPSVDVIKRCPDTKTCP